MVATARTESVWPVSGLPMGVPVARSHTRTAPSLEPVMAIGRPSSSAVITARTESVWPMRGLPIRVPVARLPPGAFEKAARMP